METIWFLTDLGCSLMSPRQKPPPLASSDHRLLCADPLSAPASVRVCSFFTCTSLLWPFQSRTVNRSYLSSVSYRPKHRPQHGGFYFNLSKLCNRQHPDCFSSTLNSLCPGRQADNPVFNESQAQNRRFLLSPDLQPPPRASLLPSYQGGIHAWDAR